MAKAKKKPFELGPAKFYKGEAVMWVGKNFTVIQVVKNQEKLVWMYEIKNIVSKDSFWSEEHNLRKSE